MIEPGGYGASIARFTCGARSVRAGGSIASPAAIVGQLTIARISPVSTSSTTAAPFSGLRYGSGIGFGLPSSFQP